MAYAKKDKYFTAAEYLAFEREATTKHEFIDGLILNMAGGSPIHNRICFNLITSVGIQLRGTSCLGFTSDQKVRTESEDLFYYPDLSIVCGEPIYHDKQQDVLLNPLVIIEVLSPSTEEYDRSEKFARFQDIKSLKDYVLISQTRPAIEHYIRQQGKKGWIFTFETDLEAEIEIESIKCRLKLAEIYERIVFPGKTSSISLVEKTAAKKSRKSRKK